MPNVAKFLLAMLLCPCLASAQVAPAYHATLIGDFWGDMRINDHGQVALTRYGTPMLWSRDTGLVPIERGQANVLVTAFNNAGTMVGAAESPPKNEEWTYYQPVASFNGGPIARVTSYGIGGGAADVNEHDTIVGGVLGSNDLGWYRRGFVHRPGGDMVFADFLPQAVNNKETMVGIGLKDDGYTIEGIKLWRDGQLTAIDNVPGTRPMFINDREWIVGTTDDYLPWLWRDGEYTQLWRGSVFDLTESGAILGEYHIDRPVLWVDGVVHELAPLWNEPEWEGWTMAHAATINERGEIGALVWNWETNEEAMVLLSPLPVPEPGQGALLLAGLALLAPLALRVRPVRRSA